MQKIGSQPQKQIKVIILKMLMPEKNGPTHRSSITIWTLSCTFSVIESLIALVNDPEPEHPLRGDLAEEFLKDYKKFVKNAEEFTKKYSEKRPNDF